MVAEKPDDQSGAGRWDVGRDASGRQDLIDLITSADRSLKNAIG
jgi:hypothetical protein